MAHPQAVTFLKAGIVATRSGDKVQMRSMLRQATDLDPGNESAWLWRANCADTPDEAVECLRKALALNPAGRIARAGLPDALVRAAVAGAADRPRARRMLEEATALDARHELAWLWRAGLADAPDQALGYLRRVLAINPDNKKAQAGLARYEAKAARVWHCPVCAAATADPKPACAGCECVVTLENPAAFDGARPAGRRGGGAAAARRLPPVAQRRRRVRPGAGVPEPRPRGARGAGAPGGDPAAGGRPAVGRATRRPPAAPARDEWPRRRRAAARPRRR